MTYYDPTDLRRFPEIAAHAPALGAAFFDWYGKVFADGALPRAQKALIGLAVAHAVQCAYCIDAFTSACLETGSTQAEMTEAVHAAAAVRGGASLVHGLQMRRHADRLSM